MDTVRAYSWDLHAVLKLPENDVGLGLSSTNDYKNRPFNKITLASGEQEKNENYFETDPVGCMFFKYVKRL
jgi:hypothetical protein